ncbi:MAG TPA: phosphatase PAP2 family protein [Longimicrobiales bacterium]
MIHRNALPRQTLAALILCLIAPPGLAYGQEGRELNNAIKDVLHVWSAPAHLDGSDLPGVATLFGATGVALFVDEPVLAWLRRHPESLPVLVLTPFREGRPLNMLGRSYFLVGTSAALFLAGSIGDDIDLRNAGRGCATSVMATTFSRHLVARLLGRTRPRHNRGAFVIRPFAWGDWEMRSFPGGHGANAMTCVTFWNRRFDLGAAEPVLYGIAAAVGAGRVVDEAHWTSDTVFGLGYGHAIGREVARQQERRDGDSPAAQPSLVLGFTISF